MRDCQFQKYGGVFEKTIEVLADEAHAGEIRRNEQGLAVRAAQRQRGICCIVAEFFEWIEKIAPKLKLGGRYDATG